MATITAHADIKKLLRKDGKKSCLENRSAKLAIVGENMIFGGIASRSSLVLKAPMIIQITGRKKMMDTSHSTRW
jgi:hypothetical protein